MENMFRLMDQDQDLTTNRCIWVNGPVIVGAGPSGLATAACLSEQNVPFVVLESADCIASLWQKRTYDRLKLHLPKQFCQLPKMPFPEDFPEYPTKRQFIDYLDSYATRFEINPKFNECVQTARFDETSGLWRVKTVSNIESTRSEVEYICPWLVVATGENAERVMPEIEGLSEFSGEVIHDHLVERKSHTSSIFKIISICSKNNMVSPPPSLPQQPRPSPSSPSRLPQRQQSNPFLNVAPQYPLNIANHVPDPHRMDTLSWTALGYCFAAGLEFNAIFAQVANPNNVSFRVQLLSLLLNVALCLLIAANGIFARTHPRMAFVMDRAGSVIVLLSSTIAAMPTIPEYVSIGLAVFMIIVYAYQRFYS